MRVRGYYKYDASLIDNKESKQISSKYFGDMRVKFLKKGIKLFDFRFRVGYSNDDFANNLFTILGEWNAVKVPRIIAKRLLKRLSAR